MNILKQIVGVDISMNTFNAKFGTTDNTQQIVLSSDQSFNNALPGFKKILKWALTSRVSANIPLIFVMEATGVYYQQLAYFLVENNCSVAVVLPNKIKNYCKSLSSKSKTDPLDAAAITRFGLERQLPLWTPPTETLKALHALTREYRALKVTITEIKNQRHALRSSCMPLAASLKRKQQTIALLEKQVSQIELELHDLVNADSSLSERVPKICSAKGIGFITVVSVLAETQCFKLVTKQKQLASYAGYDIVFNDSGLKKGKTSISKKGNRFLRNAVFMPALAAIRHNPQMKTFYQRLIAKGKNKKLALIAVARKLLLLIYALWKNNSAYDPNY
ncbi:MAG: IS110 family transposase [Bacteroidota bacterium]|nr:IS110 family transposase [Bacteroidota bacterium]